MNSSQNASQSGQNYFQEMARLQNSYVKNSLVNNYGHSGRHYMVRRNVQKKDASEDTASMMNVQE